MVGPPKVLLFGLTLSASMNLALAGGHSRQVVAITANVVLVRDFNILSSIGLRVADGGIRPLADAAS
jgi:hypothetical protein